VLAIILALSAIAMVMIVMSYYARGSLASSQANSVEYGPGDAQSLFFSSLFCEELESIKNTLYSEGFENSSLYLLKESPSLSAQEQFTISGKFEKAYQQNFHFYTDSNITVDACTNSITDDQDFGSFYLIKGKSAYLDWKSGSEDANNKNIEAPFHVTTICSQDGVKQARFSVEEEDQYYLIFASGNTSKSMAAISANVTVQRKLYSFENSSVIDYCQFSVQQPCSIKVPFQVSTYVLLLYGQPLDWRSKWSNSPIEIFCKGRMWFYMLLVALGTFLVTLVTFVACLTCYCCADAYNRGDEATTPLLSSRTGRLYGTAVPAEKEMRNPTKYSHDEAFKHGGGPVDISRQSRAPFKDYQPPSFRENSVGLGTPLISTFTTD